MGCGSSSLAAWLVTLPCSVKPGETFTFIDPASGKTFHGVCPDDKWGSDTILVNSYEDMVGSTRVKSANSKVNPIGQVLHHATEVTCSATKQLVDGNEGSELSPHTSDVLKQHRSNLSRWAVHDVKIPQKNCQSLNGETKNENITQPGDKFWIMMPNCYVEVRCPVGKKGGTQCR